MEGNAMITENEISEAIALACDEREGSFSLEFKDEEKEVIVSGMYEKSEYQEDDYFTGTGAWVCKSATVDIQKLTAYDDEGNEINTTLNTREIERMSEDILRR